MAFAIWGLAPVYYKALQHLPAMEILMHRVVWSFVMLAPLVVAGRWSQAFRQSLANRRLALVLAGTAILVSSNWFVFIWAINNGQILQTSLGYFINPLVNMFLGRLFLGERLRSAQKVAVMLAGAGVAYLSFFYGAFPHIALFLAFTFGAYGLIRKTMPVGALVGLAAETLFLSVPALIYLVDQGLAGSGAFFKQGPKVDCLLMGTAFITALPLLLFTLGARRIQLTTLGFLQYIGPSITFVLAVAVYREPVGLGQWVTFALIWTALAINSVDSIRCWHQHHHPG
jgi:chloramphenicol-sensitive protein RarD